MRRFPTLMLGLGLAAISAGAIADEGKSDASLTGSVKSALISNDATKARQINVETKDGVVQLSGFVDSAAAKSAAEATAKNVEGVQKVENKLLIRDPDRSTGAAVDDTVIAAKVKSQIAGKAGLGTASDVNVEVNSGVVELSGFVGTSAEKTHAGELARGINGVKDVRNNITVKPAG
ncbi:MAG TPA: BON domain-containing protein [Povalibacter sp.]|uniref:BON domain-containing protein n=1 Tax=Povalibacter sp. TaxID=1962978 RepID=UPI002B549DD8|nr:BON domain-containing protein [Povalibacter sp.]HMN45305.1 BON domain-containing protein [Povalibacter sp.]